MGPIVVYGWYCHYKEHYRLYVALVNKGLYVTIFYHLCFFTWGWEKVIWLTSVWIWQHLVVIFIIMHDHPWISSGWNELFGHLLPALWFSWCSEDGTHLLSVICWFSALQLSFTSITCQPHAGFRSSAPDRSQGRLNIIVNLHFLNSSPLPVIERFKIPFFS